MTNIRQLIIPAVCVLLTNLAQFRATDLCAAELLVSVPAGNFQKCLVIEESTPLEPGKKELKKYAPHVGLIVDGDLKLVRYGKK